MDALAKLATFAALALLLIAANIWFAQTFYRAFFRAPSADRIPPFQILGKADPDGKLAGAMPYMLRARLQRISHEMRDAMNALTQEPGRVPSGLTDAALATSNSAEIGTQDIDVSEFILVSEKEFGVFDPLDFNMTVGGVQAGPVIAWIHRQLVQDRLLQISINYSGSDGKARPIVYGNVAGGEVSLYLSQEEFSTSEPSDDEVIDMIAYSIVQQQYREQLPVLGAYKTAGFRRLMRTLSAVADLNRRIQYGRTPLPEEYKELASALSELVNTVSNWRPLVHLAAALAENGKDYESAKRFYTTELQLIDEDDTAGRESLSEKIRTLEGILVAGRGEATGTAADSAVAGGPLIERIHELLGVTSFEMPKRPSIAVIGDPPSHDILPQERITVLGDWAGTANENTEHFDSVIRAVQLVAPKAHFIFRAGMDWSTVGMVEAIQDIMQRTDPDILLVTLGPLSGPIFEDLFAQVVNKNTLVVAAAGNRIGQPAPFQESAIADRILIVSSVSLQGLISSFTQRGEKVVWAPGESIPVFKEKNSNRLQPQAGTTYAASLAAGLVARVLAEYPNVDRAELLDVLRAQSQPAPRKSEPKILNLNATLKALAAPPPGAIEDSLDQPSDSRS